jgi:hypothetical protein
LCRINVRFGQFAVQPACRLLDVLFTQQAVQPACRLLDVLFTQQAVQPACRLLDVLFVRYAVQSASTIALVRCLENFRNLTVHTLLQLTSRTWTIIEIVD